MKLDKLRITLKVKEAQATTNRSYSIVQEFGIARFWIFLTRTLVFVHIVILFTRQFLAV